MNDILNKAKKIKCLICDVDGVLTNGILYLDNHGNELKAFHVHDGVGLKLLMSAGIQVAVITTSQNAIIDHRMRQLGITHYFKCSIDKTKAFEELKQGLGLHHDEFAYIGDDLPDLAIMRQIGLSVAVANAVNSIKEFATMTTLQPGGQGAIREVCDLILRAQSKEEEALQRYLAS